MIDHFPGTYRVTCAGQTGWSQTTSGGGEGGGSWRTAQRRTLAIAAGAERGEKMKGSAISIRAAAVG